MPEMPRNEHAEDENRHHDERNRDEQGLGIGSEYQPPTKQEPLHIRSEPTIVRGSNTSHCTLTYATGHQHRQSNPANLLLLIPGSTKRVLFSFFLSKKERGSKKQNFPRKRLYQSSTQDSELKRRKREQEQERYVRETGGVGSYIIPFPSFVDSLLRLRHGRRRRRSSGQCHCPISDRPPNRVVRARRNRRAHAEREIRSRGGGIEWEGRWAEARRGEAKKEKLRACVAFEREVRCTTGAFFPA